jgi:hypothetical protein
MRSIAFITVTGMLLSGCGGDSSANACVNLCDELMGACQYSAFPDRDSCLSGCSYSAELGSDIPGQHDCVEAAECNTFAVLECEHAFGQVE